MKNITLSSNYNFVSGYRELLKSLLNGLPEHGYNLIPRTYSTISSEYVPFFNKDLYFNNDYLDLCLLSIINDIDNINPLLHVQFDRPRILITMWESTRINDLLIEILNKFVCIIVPNEYNKKNLIRQGCTTKIEVVQLFCDTNHFKYQPHLDHNETIFGISNEDPRKNLDRVQKSFIKAFNNKKDVKLCVKANRSSLETFINSNIVYENKNLSIFELRNWYYNIDIYISGVTCEGWGMMQQESMCCGRPVIYTDYGGLTEFINEECGFPVNYYETSAKYFWSNAGGKWSQYDEEDMIEKMIYCYDNRDEVKHKGYLAAKHASQFTKERFLKKIDSILSEYL